MKRPTKGYSGQEVALFPTMLDVTKPSTSPSRITSSPSHSPEPSPQHSPEHTTVAPTQPSPTQPTQPSPGEEQYFPTPHDSPLHAVHSHGSDEGSLKPNELMNLVTKLSDRIAVLEDDLRKTKKTYSSAFTKLILRVKKLESQIKTGKTRRKARIVHSDEEDIEDDSSKQGKKLSDAKIQEKASTASDIPVVSTAEEISTTGRTVTYIRRSAKKRTIQDKGKIARDEEIARQWDEEERQRAMSEAKSTKKIDWNDPSVIRYHALKMKPKTIAEAKRNMIKYLKNQGNYKISDFKGMSYNEIRPIFEKIEEKDVATQKEMKEVSKESRAKRKKYIPKKSTRKRQKMEENAEKEELKGFLDIIPIEEVPIEVESLSTKFLIVDWKTYTLTEKFMYYQVFRGDGSSKNYKVLSEMLEDFDRQDVEELYRLVKERYSTSRPEGYDLMLWGDLHTLFEPDEEDEIWKNQHEYNVISWSLYDFCGIHILLMQNGIAIHMLTEKKYPLSQEMISKMLKKKLEVDHESSQAFELLSSIMADSSDDSLQIGLNNNNEVRLQNSESFIEDTRMGEMEYSRNNYKDPSPDPNTGSRVNQPQESRVEKRNRRESLAKGQTTPKKNYVSTHPSYLRTLSQFHSEWPFGAIAELVDNSKDAKATILDISIEMIGSSGNKIPMLAVVDNGHGMGHDDISKMVMFGRKQPDIHDPNRIGRYGVGFKHAAMGLGKDALVITQTANSRSIAFLSRTLNDGKDSTEIPIVTYARNGHLMGFDTNIQDKASAKCNLHTIIEFSPFNKYYIGEKIALFDKQRTGTQVYIWNLEQCGSEYSLEWDAGLNGRSSFHQGDIFIRSRRARSRFNQVRLDYSLRSYLEVIFLDPRMAIKVQGSLVKSRPLARFLHNTSIQKGSVSEKPVQLVLGHTQYDLEQRSCGIFLYWHGRLIEAYKMVGSMTTNGEKSHGIIGVIDVTKVMDDGGDAGVRTNKQQFKRCKAYDQLEDWLGEKADEYMENTIDKETSGSQIRPDHEWAQCNMCRQWRMLDPKFDSKTLPIEWFCYMMPFNGKCDMPEEEIQEPRVEVVSSPKVSRVRQHRSGPERLCDIPEEEIQGPRAIAESSESIRDTCNEISPQQKTRQYKRKPKNAAGDIPEEDIQGPRVIVESSQQTGDTCKGKPAPKKKRQYQSKPKDAAGTVQQLRTLPKRQCRKD
ncbi:MORC family CW-type zinc finger protein 2B-like protein isoform X1 [Tanacetum coccineum]